MKSGSTLHKMILEVQTASSTSIEERCRLLAENPMMGRRRPVLGPNLRSFPIGNYLIFYVPMENGIEILRVISGFRDIDGLF